MTVVTYTSPGTANWTCPTGVSAILAECWGAGGAGTSTYSPSGLASQGGGQITAPPTSISNPGTVSIGVVSPKVGVSVVSPSVSISVVSPRTGIGVNYPRVSVGVVSPRTSASVVV